MPPRLRVSPLGLGDYCLRFPARRAGSRRIPGSPQVLAMRFLTGRSPGLSHRSPSRRLTRLSGIDRDGYRSAFPATTEEATRSLRKWTSEEAGVRDLPPFRPVTRTFPVDLTRPIALLAFQPPEVLQESEKGTLRRCCTGQRTLHMSAPRSGRGERI